MLGAGAVVEALTQRTVDVGRTLPVVRDVLAGVDASLDRWGARADAETRRREDAVAAFVRRMVPAVAEAVLARVDVAAIAQRLPIGEIVTELVAAIDLDALLDLVDLDAVLARINVDALLLRVDVDGIVRRVDVEALMQRVDLDALMTRIEMKPIVDRVLDDVDVGGIVRESTGSITSDAVDGARISAMRLDNFVGRVADRVLLRGTADRNPPAEEDDGA